MNRCIGSQRCLFYLFLSGCVWSKLHRWLKISIVCSCSHQEADDWLIQVHRRTAQRTRGPLSSPAMGIPRSIMNKRQSFNVSECHLHACLQNSQVIHWTTIHSVSFLPCTICIRYQPSWTAKSGFRRTDRTLVRRMQGLEIGLIRPASLWCENKISGSL